MYCDMNAGFILFFLIRPQEKRAGVFGKFVQKEIFFCTKNISTIVNFGKEDNDALYIELRNLYIYLRCCLFIYVILYG